MYRTNSPALVAILLLLVFSGCRYKPFVKYYFPKKETGLPKFSKSEYFKGEVNDLRMYDITTYDWHVKVMPESKRISGTMKIDFTMERSSDTIMLDLQHRLKAKSIDSNAEIKKWKQTSDLLYVIFSEPLSRGANGTLAIDYEGKPTSISKEGPIQWKEDKNGIPWISTQTEGVGAHFMMPCKELLYDEPERCFIRVEVPEDLTAVANGKLDSISKTSDGFKTFHWSVFNPINIYNISFNIGDFVKIEKPYTDVEGVVRVIDIYALRQDEQQARVFYEQTALHMGALEGLFGVFPWWRDGCKIVQSTLGGGAMEHQSAISMGSILTNDYRPPKDSLQINTTLLHELAHEWWGNLVTGYDYCDMWLHEGFATYAETLVVAELYQPRYYDVYIRWLAQYVGNRRPLLKTCGVRYNSWVTDYDQDIYNKGALMLHTVRRQLDNDDLFFKTLKDALVEFQRQNITTEQFISFFSNQTRRDFSNLFDIYLKYPDPPKLQYEYDSLNAVISYKWAKPLNSEFPLWVKMTVGDDKVLLNPTIDSQQVNAQKKPAFDIADFGYVLTEEGFESKKGNNAPSN